jgi:hypothetical protein
MKKEMGTSLGLAALLMVLLHPIMPEGSRAGSTGAATKLAEKPKSAVGDGAQQEPIDGPWLTIRSFFHSETQTLDAQKKLQGCDDIEGRLGKRVQGPANQAAFRACIQQFMGLPDDFEQRFSSWSIVASVADPLHTRMALTLDRQIEAIEAAAESAGWQFAGQWLSWGDRVVLPEDDMMKRRSQRRLMREQEEVPGVLLFRRKAQAICAADQPTLANSAGERGNRPAPGGATALANAPAGQCAKDDILTILLVGETPTTGVPGGSFFAAMNLAAAMTDRSHQIGLLGPIYSGSLPSLGDLLHTWMLDYGDGPSPKIASTVYSGSVSSRNSAQDFIRHTGLGFRSGIADSPFYEATVEEVLKKYNVKTDRVARLVESGTVFASYYVRNNKDKDKKGKGKSLPSESPIRQYIFPRGISQLRNAYREQPGGSDGKQDGSSALALGFSLHDSDEGEDLVPTFSKQTPFTQDAILTSIMNDLRRREIRLVDIVATNPMDTLFLCRVLKSQCPDARILIEDAEILFIADARQDPLRGTLFLSTYPMFAQGEDWLQPNSSVRLFSGPSYQGMHNAVNFLMRDLGALIQVPGAPAGRAEFRGWNTMDGKAGRRVEPGIWLLSLSRTGFTPIDAFESKDPCSLLRAQTPAAITGKCGPLSAPETEVVEQSLSAAVLSKMPLPPESWLLSTLLLTIVSLTYCGFVLAANRPGAPLWSCWFTMGYAGGALELPLFSAGAALSSMLYFLVIPFWLFWPGTPSPGWLLAIVAIASCAAVAPPVVFVVTRNVRTSVRSGVSWWNYVFVAGLYSSMVIPWAYCCVQGGASSAAAQMFVYRAFELPGSVSPAVPMLTTCFAMGAASVMRAFRYAAVDGMSKSLISLPDQLQDKAKRVSIMLMRAPGLGGKHLVTRPAPLAVAFVVLLIANMDGGIDPFDRTGFVWAIRIANFCLLWTVFHYCQDLVLRWLAFKDLLAATRTQLSDSEIEQFSLKKSSAPSYFLRAATQIHNIAFTLALCFVALVVFFSTYSPQAPNALGRWLLVLFLGVGAIVTTVLVGIEKDYVLSKARGSEPGELNAEFWLRLAGFGALPLLGLVGHLFPELSGFVSNWVQPSVEALR